MPAVDGEDRLDDLLGAGRVVVGAREHEHGLLGVDLAGAAHDVDAGAVGQLQVHDEHLGADGGQTAPGLGHGGGLPHDGEPWVGIDHRDDPPTDHLVVVHEHDADRGGGLGGGHGRPSVAADPARGPGGMAGSSVGTAHPFTIVHPAPRPVRAFPTIEGLTAPPLPP